MDNNTQTPNIGIDPNQITAAGLSPQAAPSRSEVIDITPKDTAETSPIHEPNSIHIDQLPESPTPPVLHISSKEDNTFSSMASTSLPTNDAPSPETNQTPNVTTVDVTMQLSSSPFSSPLTSDSGIPVAQVSENPLPEVKFQDTDFSSNVPAAPTKEKFVLPPLPSSDTLTPQTAVSDSAPISETAPLDTPVPTTPSSVPTETPTPPVAVETPVATQEAATSAPISSPTSEPPVVSSDPTPSPTPVVESIPTATPAQTDSQIAASLTAKPATLNSTPASVTPEAVTAPNTGATFKIDTSSPLFEDPDLVKIIK